MRASLVWMAVWLCLGGTLMATELPGVFHVRGRGADGKRPYQGGGVVEFLDASLDAQVVHYDEAGRFPFPLRLEYRVIEPAPVALASRLGTEHWRVYSFADQRMCALYSDERIELSRRGRHVAEASRAWFSPSYGGPPPAGLVSIRGHHYFLIDGPDGPWLDVTEPPLFFDRRQVVRKLTFTLADLTRFRVAIAGFQSTWESGGPFRVRLAVRDGQDEDLPVVNVPLVATAGRWRCELGTEWAPLDEPTGWMCGRLADDVPDEIHLSGSVRLQTPDGLRSHPVRASFRRGEGLVPAESFRRSDVPPRFARNDQGMIRETRAIWVSPMDITTAEAIETLVARCRQGRLNVILANILVRNTFMAQSDLWPTSKANHGFDPLAHLIARAHAASLEVHPWFCVTYRDQAFRQWFAEAHGVAIDMIDRRGRTLRFGADIHRPEYRDFVVRLMVGVARDYPVDGIHLDYIRSMGQCFCKRCREEFARRFGKPLEEAGPEQWSQWQREAVGEIVRRTAEGVRRVRPRAKLSAAVFANMAGGAAQGQDPAGWARRGWLDIVIPMDYQIQALYVRQREREFLEALDDDDKLVSGLSLYMRSGTQVLSRPPELVREQIQLVRRMGIRGYCLFAYRHLSDAQLEALHAELNTELAVPHFR